MGIYDRLLAIRTRRQAGDPPGNVALVITERDLLAPGAYRTLEDFLGWALAHDASTVYVYVSVLDKEVVPTLRRALGDIDAPAPLAVRGPTDDHPVTEPVQVSIGLGGKYEFTTAVKRLAVAVEDGELAPEEIDDAAIERHLIFGPDPDLVIKTGAERLSDFMIWQSVYSELYFTDVNWQNFRYRDYLRAVREYKRRHRRFGQ